jgi:hypothetical protein
LAHAADSRFVQLPGPATLPRQLHPPEHAMKLSQRLGQQFFVENRSGAGGATQHRSPPEPDARDSNDTGFFDHRISR